MPLGAVLVSIFMLLLFLLLFLVVGDVAFHMIVDYSGFPSTPRGIWMIFAYFDEIVSEIGSYITLRGVVIAVIAAVIFYLGYRIETVQLIAAGLAEKLEELSKKIDELTDEVGILREEVGALDDSDDDDAQ